MPCRLILVLALALSLILAAGEASAETFCSCATDSGTSVGAYKNAACTTLGVPKMAGTQLDCEDYEGARWTQTSGAGSLIDDSSCGSGFGIFDRARGSIAAERFGSTGFGGWNTGQPASAPAGERCGGGACGRCSPSVLLTGDPLHTDESVAPELGVFRAGDAAEFFGGATGPAQPLAGTASLAEIVTPGNTTYLFEGGNINPLTNSFAYSYLQAFPDNLEPHIIKAPWKGAQQGADSHLTGGWGGLTAYGDGASGRFPFDPVNIFGLTNMCARAAGATYIVGSSANTICDGYLGFTNPQNYNFNTDWPLGTTGLVQVYWGNWATTTTEFIFYFTPAGGTRRTLWHVTNLDTSGAGSPNPFRLNAYYNGNQNNYCEGIPGGNEACYTDYDTGRLTDNLLVQSWSSPPANPASLLPTPSQMQLDAEAPPPNVSITGVTLTPSSGTAPLNDVDVSVSYQDNTGPVDLYVDCSGGTSWTLAVSDDAASPVSVSDFCDYPSQVTAPSQIAVRIVDSDADEDTGSDALSVTEAAGKWATSVIPYPNNGTIDSPFLSYDSRRIYFSYTPTCFRQLAGGAACPAGASLSGAQGGIDLYYVEWNGSAWSAPVNLGTNINTELNEVAPWLSDDELTLIFYRHTSELVGTRQNMIATRANRDAAWGVPTVLGGDYGSTNQTWDRTRSDLAVHEPTGEVFLWEARDASVSTYAGHLGRGTSTGSYTWSAPSYYNGATCDLDLINETQPYVSRDGLTLLFNRRPVDGSSATQLWKVTRASTGVNFTADPSQVTVSGLYAWGELSADGDEAAFVAQAVDFGQPGYSTHLIRMTGTPASASLGAPTVLNPFSAPTAATFCCRN